MTAVYLMEQLVTNYHLHDELQSVDVIIIPVTNPDGFVYSQEFVRVSNVFYILGILIFFVIFPATFVEEE